MGFRSLCGRQRIEADSIKSYSCSWKQLGMELPVSLILLILLTSMGCASAVLFLSLSLQIHCPNSPLFFISFLMSFLKDKGANLMVLQGLPSSLSGRDRGGGKISHLRSSSPGFSASSLLSMRLFFPTLLCFRHYTVSYMDKGSWHTDSMSFWNILSSQTIFHLPISQD